MSDQEIPNPVRRRLDGLDHQIKFLRGAGGRRIRILGPLDIRFKQIIGGKFAEVDPHAVQHQDGGTDEINVQGLSGKLADAQTPEIHHTRHEDGGDDEIALSIPQIVASNAPTSGDLLIATGPATAKWEKNVAYTPVSLTKNAGGAESGSYADLAVSDGTVYSVAELAATPGFDVEIGFSGIVNFNKVFLHMKYDGSLVHDVNINIWNYNTLAWDLIGTIHAQSDFTAVSYDVSPTNHVSGGAARIQIYHASAGNASHDLYLDQVLIQNVVVSGDGVTDHGAMTGLGDNDHPQYARLAIAQGVTQIPVNTYDGTTLAGSFPFGHSMMLANGVAGFPSTQGILHTYIDTTYGADGLGFSFQYFYPRGGNEGDAGQDNQIWFRKTDTINPGSAWNAWTLVSPNSYTGGTIAQDPNTTTYPLIVTNHANDPGGGAGEYYYIQTFFYSGNPGNYKVQIAHQFTSFKVFTRYEGNGIWSSWQMVSQTNYSKWNSISDDPNTTEFPLIVTNHANDPGAGADGYWYIQTFIYTGNPTNYRYQVAVGHGGTKMKFRKLDGGVWGSWLVMPSVGTDGYINILDYKVIGRVAGVGPTVLTGASIFLGANCYSDQSSVAYRIDTGLPASVITLNYNGEMFLYKASAGANPIASWDLANGVKVWTAESDGSGSGLDADLLDARQGTVYLDHFSAGSHIIFHAFNVQGVVNPEYQFEIRPEGGAWVTGQPYTQTPYWDWDTVGSPGTYEARVLIRANGTTTPVYTEAGCFVHVSANTGAELRALSNRGWHRANDGSGSGLDADLLDGQEGSFYDHTTHGLGVSLTSGQDANNCQVTGFYWANSNHPEGGGVLLFVVAYSPSWVVAQIAMSYETGNVWSRMMNAGSWGSWIKLWSPANDGASSGLDADLLDGNEASAFAVAAKGVTNGDSHDHSGGDGAQIDHVNLSNKGSNTHAQIDTFLAGLPYNDTTFTPVLRGTGTAGTGTYTTQSGWYYRVGKMVFFVANLSWSAHTGTGNMVIGGLPYNVVGDNCPVNVTLGNMTFTGIPAALAIGGTDYAALYTFASGGALTQLAMDTAGDVWISGWYRMAS